MTVQLLLMAMPRRSPPGSIRMLARRCNPEPWRRRIGSIQRQRQQQFSVAERYFASNHNTWWNEIDDSLTNNTPNRSFGSTRNQIRSNNNNNNNNINNNNNNTARETPTSTLQQQKELEQTGAWILLSALEKAKEAELMGVARLVAINGGLPPSSSSSSPTVRERTATSTSPSSSFVSLPDVVARAKHSAESFHGVLVDTEEIQQSAQAQPQGGITGDDVRALLDATRHGAIIDLPTVVALIEGVTLWLRKFRPTSKLVTLPPLQSEQTLTIVGDLHGSLNDLATVLEVMPGTEPNANNMLLFNGDLADRGDHGIETISIVCALCLAYPEFVYLNRGNHEDLALSFAYGLAEELRTKYGPEPECLTRALDGFFRALPLATIVEDDALIVHGGPPPPCLHSSTNMLANMLDSNQHRVLGGKGYSRTTIVNRMRIQEMPKHICKGQEIIEALLWSDPWVDETGRLLEEREGNIRSSSGGGGGSKSNNNNNADQQKREQNEQPLGWHPNPSRGAGFVFDAGIVRRCLQMEGLTRMVRSHEQIQTGCVRYKIPTEPMVYKNTRPSTSNIQISSRDNNNNNTDMELFTVFSASKYPYKEGFNQGAVLELKAKGKHKIRRYVTEDDDEQQPIVEGRVAAQANGDATIETTTTTNVEQPCTIITLEVIRENLFEAIRRHECEILRSLRLVGQQRTTPTTTTTTTATVTVTDFDTVVDILIKALNLEGETNSLKTQGAKIVLAKALGIECIDDHVDLEAFSDSIARRFVSREQHKTMEPNDKKSDSSSSSSERNNHHGHKNHDNDHRIVNKATTTVEGIDMDEIWDLVDANKDGRLSLSEWLKLREIMRNNDPDDEVLEG